MDDIRLCDYCAKEPAVWRCQCTNPKCRIMTCQKHKTIAQNPARIPTKQIQGGAK